MSLDFYIGANILSSRDEDIYAMECPALPETLMPNALTSPRIYVKQNVDSGLPPVERGSVNWQEAAQYGMFNYTACSNCNLIGYTDKVISPKPDCNGECFYVEDKINYIDHGTNFCYSEFDCGGCDEENNIPYYETWYGWQFNNFKCNPSSCNNLKFSCNFCDCKNLEGVDDVTDERGAKAYFKKIVNILYKGSTINNCNDYCSLIGFDYNRDGYIDILDIIDVIKCMTATDCNSHNKCI